MLPFHKADGDCIVSKNNSSLAFDETVKELENHFDGNFEPELKVIVNAHFSKASFSQTASQDVVQVSGRITVSF